MCFVFRSSAASIYLAAFSVVAANQTFAADGELGDVVVTAARVEQPISQVIGSVTVITRAEIDQRQAQSLQDLLRGEAGLDISNRGGLGKISAIFLRGANSSQTLILVDGVRLGSATSGETSVELIPVDQIERIEIVRGPRSSLYGADAMGGVIQIFTRKNNGVNVSVSASSYDTQSYSAGFGMQADALRFNINGNYIDSGGFNSCNNSAGCFTNEPDKDGYRNDNVSARVGYAFGKVADLEFSTLYAKGRTEYDGAFQNQSTFTQSAPVAKLHINASDSLGITLSGGITQDKSDSFKDGVYSSRFNTEKRNASGQVDWRLDQQRFSVGADYVNDLVDSDTIYDQTKRDNTGLFALWLGKFSNHEFSVSARHDDNQQFGTHHTGNLGWKWFVLPQALAINAGWGQAFHAPSFNDLYYPGFSNAKLKPERAQSYELGAAGEYSGLNWSLQLYSTQAKDLIAYNNVFVPDNISEARLQGAELTLSGKWDKLSAGVNYTAQNPRSRAAGANFDHVLQRRSRQSGRLDASYDFGGAQLSTSINVVGPRYENLANTQRMGGYTTVDLRGELALHKDFALQVKLGNVFDHRYETVRYYNQEGRTVYVTLRYRM